MTGAGSQSPRDAGLTPSEQAGWLIEVPLGAGARGVVTTRALGHGDGDRDGYAAMNLALHVGDDPDRVLAARARLAGALGVDSGQIAWMNQVHSTTLAVARRLPLRTDAGAYRDPVTADALILDRDDPACQGARGVAVLVADCVPLLLASVDGRCLAAVHAGRRGMLGGIVPTVIDELARRGVKPRDLVAAIGPSICGGCYEVDEAMAVDAARCEPACAARTRWGTPAIDVAAGVRSQLARAGVAQVSGPLACTLEDDRFYSFRRQVRTGRLAAVAVLR